MRGGEARATQRQGLGRAHAEVGRRPGRFSAPAHASASILAWQGRGTRRHRVEKGRILTQLADGHDAGCRNHPHLASQLPVPKPLCDRIAFGIAHCSSVVPGPVMWTRGCLRAPAGPVPSLARGRWDGRRIAGGLCIRRAPRGPAVAASGAEPVGPQTGAVPLDGRDGSAPPAQTHVDSSVRGKPLAKKFDGFVSSWPQTTEALVGAATAVFTLLVAPQVIKNAHNLASGGASSLSILTWQGFATSWMGNIMLLLYFTRMGEPGAQAVQALGVAGNVLVLAQIFQAGFVPPEIMATVVAVSVACAAVVLRRRGAAGASTGNGDVAHQKDSYADGEALAKAVSLAALAVIPCVVGQSVAPLLHAGVAATVGRVAVAVGAVMASAFAWTHVLSPNKGLASDVFAACGVIATALFMLQPVAQLAKIFITPESIAGLSLGTLALGTFGNALMVPRAVHVSDRVWIAGTVWGVTMGWAQLASVAWASRAAPILAPWVLPLATLSLGAFATAVQAIETHWRRADRRRQAASAAGI